LESLAVYPKRVGGQVYSLSILMYSVRVDNSGCAVPGEDGGAMPTLGRDRRNDEGPAAVKKRDMENAKGIRFH